MKDDFRYLATLSIVDQISVYLMAAPPPPAAIWPVLERALNHLQQDRALHTQDVVELEVYKGLCFEGAKPATSDPEVLQHLFQYQLTLAVLAMNQARDTEGDPQLHLIAAFAAAHHLHGMAVPPLTRVVKEYFALAQNKEGGQ